MTLGHPAQDIWSIVYSATDADYRANHMEEDLRAYYTILSGYMETNVDYTEFRQELEERRVYGMVMNGRFHASCFLLLSNVFLLGTFCIATLSPTKLPSFAKEPSKFAAACREMLTAEDTADDHPDLKEIRRRVMSNMKEMVDLKII